MSARTFKMDQLLPRWLANRSSRVRGRRERRSVKAPGVATSDKLSTPSSSPRDSTGVPQIDRVFGAIVEENESHVSSPVLDCPSSGGMDAETCVKVQNGFLYTGHRGVQSRDDSRSHPTP